MGCWRQRASPPRRARLCASLLACGPLSPHSWCRGAWQTPQSPRPLLPSRPVGGTAPRTSVSMGGFGPPPPPKNCVQPWVVPGEPPDPCPSREPQTPPHPLPLPGSFRARPPGLPHQRSSADPQGCSEPPLFSALERPEGLRGGRQPSADSSREKRLGMRPGARPAQGPSPGPAVLPAKLSEKTPPAAARCCRTAAFPTHSMNVKNLFIFVSQPLYNVFLFILSTAAILVILPTVFIADLFCESCTLMLFYVKIKSI